MADTFVANSNLIQINNGSQVIFDTRYRMPHILSSVSGTFQSTNAAISNNGAGSGQTVLDPSLVRQSYGSWSSFLNTYGVWYPNINQTGSIDITRTVLLPSSGYYNIIGCADDNFTLYIDSLTPITHTGFSTSPTWIRFLNAGTHTIRLVANNTGGPGAVAVTMQEASTGAYVWGTAIPSSPGVFMNTVTDNVLNTASYYQFSNSFVWAYLKIIVNEGRTDLDIANPVFVTGSTLLRHFIDDNSMRGSYIITPMIYSGGIGFREEWQYADNYQTTGVPSYLFPTDATNTYGNMGLTYSYTLYYGRFI